jgi:hypothetical protein
MKTSYAIIIFIFLFSLMGNALNELGIYDYTVTETGISNATIEEIKADAEDGADVDDSLYSEDSSFSLFAGVQMAINAVGVFAKALASTVVIYPTMISFGFQPAIATVIQGMVSLIESIALIEFISDRRASK